MERIMPSHLIIDVGKKIVFILLTLLLVGCSTNPQNEHLRFAPLPKEAVIPQCFESLDDISTETIDLSNYFDLEETLFDSFEYIRFTEELNGVKDPTIFIRFERGSDSVTSIFPVKIGQCSDSQ